MAVYFPFFFIPLRVSSAAVNRVHPTGQQAFDRRSSLAGLLAVAVGGTRVIGPWQTPLRECTYCRRAEQSFF